MRLRGLKEVVWQGSQSTRYGLKELEHRMYMYLVACLHVGDGSTEASGDFQAEALGLSLTWYILALGPALGPVICYRREQQGSLHGQ